MAQESVAVLLIRPDRRVLLGKKNGAGEDRLFLPGGRVEVGEQIWHPVARQMTFSVCAIQPTIADRPVGFLQYYTEDAPSHIIYLFRSFSWEGEPRDSSEYSDWQWCGIDRNTRCRTMDAAGIWLRYIHDDRRFIAQIWFDKKGKVCRTKSFQIEQDRRDVF